MVEIRINGEQPTQPEQEPTQQPQQQQSKRPGFGMVRDAYRRFTTAHPDFAKAEAQQGEQQEQERRAWTQHSRSEATDQARLDQMTREEMALYEKRLKAQRSLLHRYSLLQARAAEPLTPSKQGALHRSLSTLEHQLSEHEIEHGERPVSQAAMAQLRESTGTESGAHLTAESMRIGNIGQHSAMRGEYTNTAHLLRELKRIESVLDKTYKFETSPQQRAMVQRVEDQMLHGTKVSAQEQGAYQRHKATMVDVQRQREAVGIARQRIEAGFQGVHPVVRSVGMGWGRIANLWHDPVARTALDIGMATVGAPYAANMTTAGVIAMQRPYLDFQNAQLGLARGSGGRFQGVSAARQLLNLDKSGLVPGNGLAPYARQFGLNPREVPQQVLREYGVPVHDQYSESRIAASVRMASTAGGMQLPEDQLFRGLGSAVSTGAVSNNQQGWNRYFRELQRTMAVATKQGLNESQVASGFQSFMQSQASRGVGFDFDRMARFFNSLTGVSPAGRTGALQNNIMSGIAQASNSLGGNNTATMAIGMALHGDTAQLSSALRISGSEAESLEDSI